MAQASTSPQDELKRAEKRETPDGFTQSPSSESDSVDESLYGMLAKPLGNKSQPRRETSADINSRTVDTSLSCHNSSLISPQALFLLPVQYSSSLNAVLSGPQNASEAPPHQYWDNGHEHGPSTDYFCLFPPCRYTCARKADLERHISVTHNRDPMTLIDCEHPGCDRTGKYGFTRKDQMREHMREVHKVDFPKRDRNRLG